MPVRRVSLAAGLVLVLAAALGGCLPHTTVGSLGPALRFADAPGGRVPLENGLVVPTFERQPRPQIDLDGPWRAETVTLDDDLSLTDRRESLPAIVAEAGGRESNGYDDRAWPLVEVPGSVGPPPRGAVSGAWYRRHVAVPADWVGRATTLKLEAANYVADVWLNGTHLGVHEGGSTPFALDATPALRPGRDNVIAIRVDDPPIGTRVDTVPWGLIDWWSYPGLTGSVWLEASDPVRAARADVVPHLDGADVSVAIENRGPSPARPQIRIDVYPAVLSDATLLDPDPAALLPPLPAVPGNPRLPAGEVGAPAAAPGRLAPPGRVPAATAAPTVPLIDPGGAAVATASLLIPDPVLWELGRPALYVLRVTVDAPDGRSDTLYDTFGLRRISVEPGAPRLLLNGHPVSLAGAAVHDEVLAPAAASTAGSVPLAQPLTSPAEALAQLRRAQAVNANFLRTGHEPADPDLLRLADRLGIAVWEEIPVYHFTPLTFETAAARGVAEQLLGEMALRDMNRASVLFHGVSNESTGAEERTSALAALREADRQIDGTRLVGQAAYGFDAADGTSDPLDVVGITSYFGVFYGSDANTDTAVALDAAHARYPTKPIMVLELGYWADGPADEARQVRVFQETYAAIAPRRELLPGGFVAAVAWWALDDYATSRPGITLERFGLYAPDGRPRPVAALVRQQYAALDAAARTVPRVPLREAPEPQPAGVPPVPGLVALALGVAFGGPLLVLGALTLRGHRRSRHVRRAARRPIATLRERPG